MLNTNKFGRLTLPDFKTYYKAIVYRIIYSEQNNISGKIDA